MAGSDVGLCAIDRLMGGQLDDWLRGRAHLSHNELIAALAAAPGLDGQPIGLRVSKTTIRRWRARAEAGALVPR